MRLGDIYLLPPLLVFWHGISVLVKAKTFCNLTCNSDGLNAAGNVTLPIMVPVNVYLRIFNFKHQK